VSRLRGRLAARAGNHEEADARFKSALALLQEGGNAFWIAVTELQRAEALLAAGRTADAEPLLEEARDRFVGLSADPWIDRVDQARRADSPVRVVPA
jgi:hypothetical protein